MKQNHKTKGPVNVWGVVYTFVIVANLIYLLFFYWFMEYYKQ